MPKFKSIKVLVSYSVPFLRRHSFITMNNINKADLKIILQGGILVREHSCSENETFTLSIIDGFKKVKENGKVKSVPNKEIIEVEIKKSIPAFKIMHFNREQIKYMIATPCNGISKFKWDKLNHAQRIEEHAKCFVHDEHGIDYELTF